MDVINFMNSLMCFLVSCSSGSGQVSPVRAMAFRRFLLSFCSCVQLKIMWLIVCSSSSPQGQVELGIIWNLWRYDLVRPWPVTIAVNSVELLLCWCIYCLAELFCCVPPVPYVLNTAAFCPLIFLSHYISHMYRGFMAEDCLHHNICVPCPVELNLIVIFINCNWVITRWQWLFYMFTHYEIGY